LFEFALPLLRLPWRKFLPAFLLLVLLIILYTFGLYGWRYTWIQLHVYTDFTPELNFLNGVSTHSRFSFTSVLFYGIARHIYSHIQLKILAKQLRIEKQEAELNYLKSQTNPHFLFNTLNNIYTLSRRKSDLTPESILRLSTILRFMLYETSGKFILVEQELEIIKDYIALEKLRYDDSLRINFNCEIEDSSQSIPPLLLIPLVENAFKHGVSETRGLPFIDINLSIHHQQLSFVVKNSTEESSEQKAVKENIGLTNLRRQLELLYNDYQLSVKQEKSVFSAILKINLKSHV
jgi:LytS/YehU family sensor histidine kinase